MRRVRLVVVACLLIAGASVVAAQTSLDIAMSFYLKGGAYCFRVIPFGVNLSEEPEWTVMLLTSRANRKNTFRIRSVDAGETGVSKNGLLTLGRMANDVWKFDSERAEFFERFSAGIRAGQLRARVVRIAPPKLKQATSDRQRAEVYLDFADRGSKVSFDDVPDLTPDQFEAYAEYLID